MATDPSQLFGPMPDFSRASDAAASLFGPAGVNPQVAGLLAPPVPDTSQGATPPAAVPMNNSPPPSSGVDEMRGMMSNPEGEQRAIDKLQPGSELHGRVLMKLNAMWDFGKSKMKEQYSRWNFAEQRVQAYTSLEDYERLMQSLDAPGSTPPEPVSVVVPYSYATLHAAATYIHQVLVGRKPIFPLLATLGTEADRARYMETALQSNLDASRGQETLWQLIWDPLIYSFGVVKNNWEQRTGQTIKWLSGMRQLTTETTFAGNVISAVDPYAFVPDPRVPISQCNIRGDFMFAETPVSATVLRDLAKQGLLKYVEEGLRAQRGSSRNAEAVVENRRRVKIGIRSENLITPNNVTEFGSVREGTVRLVPKDWGLGEADQSQLWKFSWFRGQIMQAEPLGMIHNMHPMAATEPTSFGHDFLSVSMHDMIGPFQDVLSWLVSSRMENVRTAINNQFIADPARVDINDVRASPIGRVIRLKQTAQGLPIKDAIMQLAVTDVTSGHITDIQTIRILADTITGINDNLRGINTSGGRRSATEARQSMQAGAQRLSSMAIRISAQAFSPLCQQMISNIQQFMPDKMWVQMTGDDGQPSSQALTPEMVVGSYNYQISDGSLPYDKQALLETWQEIMFGMAKDPELRQAYSLPEVFRYVAVLGGAKNIDQFKRAMIPQQPGTNPFVAGAAANPGAQPGAVPLGPAMPQGPIVS